MMERPFAVNPEMADGRDLRPIGRACGRMARMTSLVSVTSTGRLNYKDQLVVEMA